MQEALNWSRTRLQVRIEGSLLTCAGGSRPQRAGSCRQGTVVVLDELRGEAVKINTDRQHQSWRQVPLTRTAGRCRWGVKGISTAGERKARQGDRKGVRPWGTRTVSGKLWAGIAWGYGGN